ncbi:MAG TPA: hypothetical protein VJR06_03635 [Nitrososphaerales archaeon]|nr:hypothetical protein [Nitrososphaerales archaeon]
MSLQGPVYERARIRDYSEGFANVMGYWLFYRSFGESGKRGRCWRFTAGRGRAKPR